MNRTEEVNILCPFASVLRKVKETVDQCLLLRFLNEITIGMEVVVLLSDKVPEVCHLIKQRLLITEKQDYGLKLSCKFKFQKDKFSCKWLKETEL